MKRNIFVALYVLLFSALSAYAATEVIDGIRYTTRGATEVSCRLADGRLSEVRIPEMVIVGGMSYTVSSVEKNAFKGAKSLRRLVLPNSVKRIGRNAFEDCCNLESIVMPDQAHIDIPIESYGYGGNGPFGGCVKLSEGSGNRMKYPAYLLAAAFRKCDEVPFAAQIPSLEPSDPNEALLAALPVIEKNGAWKETEPAVETDPLSEVDRNIPHTSAKADRSFAVIIGNQTYRNGVANVDFAEKDAGTFARYCEQTLGLPQQNIRTYYNATYGDMLGALRDIEHIASAYSGDINVIFYYAGHGIPDEADRSACLMPVDSDGSMAELCMQLSELYRRLARLGARSVLVFLDACFSGAQRGEGMLMAARGVRIKTSSERPTGNMVVFSAASGEQTAYPYKEKGHGIFTYYLLEKLQQTSGDVTLGELFDHISTNVAQQSVVINRKVQLPAVSTSIELAGSWQDMKLK